MHTSIALAQLLVMAVLVLAAVSGVVPVCLGLRRCPAEVLLSE